MPNSQALTESTQAGGIMHWLLSISNIVNADSRLAPNKAIQKRLQELIKTYGPDKVWDGIRQFSTALGLTNAPFVEALFQSCPDLPELIKTEKATLEALNQWFEQNAEDVTRFHRISSAMLRANPVVEWKVEPLSDANTDFKPIMDMLFRNTEGTK